MKEMVGR